MTRWTQDPEAAAQALIVAALDEIAPEGPLLWAGAMPLEGVPGERQPLVASWQRRASLRGAGTPEPPAGHYETVFLRLPKSRPEQEMAAHQCLGALAQNGRLIVYGGNDEGIRSFQKALSVLGPVTVRATRGHGRVVELKRGDVTAVLKPYIADWRHVHADDADGVAWVSYPGLFAGGAPDAGTALLLRELTAMPAGQAVLDYGCGPGAIGAHIHGVQPATQITLLDNDSVALLAAAENVAGAELVSGDRLSAAGRRRFDLIVSNPPVHVGFKEDTAVLLRLIAEAPAHLTASGQLLLVVQRRIALDRSLAAAFGSVETLADDGRYRVWRARGRVAHKRT